MSWRRPLTVLVIGFVLLGMPAAALGVAWPAMSETLGRSLGDLGALTLATGAAYGLVSVTTGRLSQLMSAGRILSGTAFVGALGLVGYAAADEWPLLVAAAVLVGIGGGAIDSLGNAFVAVGHGPRAMGAIHAAFGLGAMVGPLLMTALLTVEWTWRIGFGLLAVAQGALGVAFVAVAARIRMPMEGRSDRPERTGNVALLGASVWVFFIYAGVEGSLGIWTFTLLTEGQGVGAFVAGIAVSAHWAALLASRVLIGVAGDRVRIDATIAWCALGIVTGIGLLWWNPNAVVSVMGLLVAGFCSGPVFPLEVLLTKGRFGADFTPWAVGYQLGAATISIAVIPAVIGVLVNAIGPLVIGGSLLALSLLMVVSIEVLRRLSASHHRMVKTG